MLADAKRTSMTNTYCVYTVLRYSWWWTVDMSETCRVLYQINLRNSASCWLSLWEYIMMHGPPNVKITHYPLDRRLGRPQIWYKHCGEQNGLLHPFGNNSQSLSYSPVVWYSSITSINCLSFCITTFSVSPSGQRSTDYLWQYLSL